MLNVCPTCGEPTFRRIMEFRKAKDKEEFIKKNNISPCCMTIISTIVFNHEYNELKVTHNPFENK